MPVIFCKREARWDVVPVSGSAGHLSLAPVQFHPVADAATGPRAEAFLLCQQFDGQVGLWVLFVRAGERLLHNGQPVAAGMRVLAHRDSLALADREPVFFSTEEAAQIEPFAGPAKVSCPRCRGGIQPGEQSVRCPACGVFHHETPERNCWTYAPTCALCTQPTALDAGRQWTPEIL